MDVTLSGGRVVDVKTTEGAELFLSSFPSGQVILHQLECIENLRQQLSQARTTQQKDEVVGLLENSYRALKLAGWKCSDAFFARRFNPQRDLVPVIRHLKGILQQNLDDSSSLWMQRGELEKHDAQALELFSLWTDKIEFVRLLPGERLLYTLADFLSGFGEERLPGRIVVKTVMELIFGFFFQLEKDLSLEQAIKQVYRCGMLDHAFQLITHPDVNNRFGKAFLEKIQAKPEFLSKYVATGTASFERLERIVQGHLGYTPTSGRSAEIQERLKGVYRLADMSSPETIDGRITCCNCHAGGADLRLLACAKCKYVLYCSKECQRADWPRHKTYCNPLPKRKETARSTVRKLCVEHTGIVLDALAKKAQELDSP
ncbi:MAG: hypothetical protein SGARI_002943, partial [Bacillariaceae sp.]